MVNNEFSIVAHWPGGFDEDGLRDWAAGLRAQLPAPEVSLGLVFLSPQFFPNAKAVLEILRVHAKIPLLAGCSSSGLIAGDKEIEGAGGLVLALYSLPGAKLKGFRFTQEISESAAGEEEWSQGWPVVATALGVDLRGSPHLPTHDQQYPVLQPALFHVIKERGHRVVELRPETL